MIVNGVDSNGYFKWLFFPENTARNTEDPIPAELRDGMNALLERYEKELLACQEERDGLDEAVCQAKAIFDLHVAAGKFLTERYFTRDNYCYVNYMENRAGKTNAYYVDKFQGIMIHSPASCKSAIQTRDTFNCYSTKKEKTGTHFLVDGDTGWVYCLLPLHCRANHCGQPMLTEKEVKPGTKSLNGKLIAIDICEPSGVKIISEEQANGLPAAYRKQYWKQMGHHYYGIAEKIDRTTYNSLSREERKEWHETKWTTKKEKEGEEKTVESVAYYRSSEKYVKEHAARAKAAALTAAELAANLCYLYGFDPLGKQKKLIFDDKKQKYYKSDTEADCVVIGHIEGNTDYAMASEHGDPENMWEMEKISEVVEESLKDVIIDKIKDVIQGESQGGEQNADKAAGQEKEKKQPYTMDDFRQEVSRQLERLRKKELRPHPILCSLTGSSTEAPVEAPKDFIPEAKDKNNQSQKQDGKENGQPADQNGASLPTDLTKLLNNIDLEQLKQFFDRGIKALSAGMSPLRFYCETTGQSDPERAKTEISKLSGVLEKAKEIDLAELARSVLRVPASDAAAQSAPAAADTTSASAAQPAPTLDPEQLRQLFDRGREALSSGVDALRFFAETTGQTDPDRARTQIEKLSESFRKQTGIDPAEIARGILKM